MKLASVKLGSLKLASVKLASVKGYHAKLSGIKPSSTRWVSTGLGKGSWVVASLADWSLAD